jgi:HD-like signal output (HDOD) protein
MQSHDDRIQQLNYTHLPVLPSGVSQLLQTLTDDSISFRELAGVIERYPTISARLISLANSAWSSPVSEITSTEMACSRLGFGVVRSTSIAIAVAAPFDYNRCPEFDARHFWSTALLAADGADWLAQCSQSETIEAGTSRAAGLIHNLGLLLLADQCPLEVGSAIKLHQEKEQQHLGVALLYFLGYDHCDAGGQLGQAWKLPVPLVQAMAHHSDEEFDDTVCDTARLVGVTCTMLHALQHSSPWLIPHQQLEYLHITPSDASQVFDRMNTQQESISELAATLFKV